MSKLFLTLFFSFTLLFQSTLIAEESSNIQQETALEAHTNEVDNEELSEAQKEADEAEAAELRESGIGEEPLPE